MREADWWRSGEAAEWVDPVRAVADARVRIWQVYRRLAATWSAVAVSSEEAAARATTAERAARFRAYAQQAREHARHLQAHADRLCPPDPEIDGQVGRSRADG